MTRVPPCAIKKEIDSLISYLIGKSICDDQNYASLKQVGKHHDIAFDNSEYVSFGYLEDYTEVYTELANKRSYTMKLIDGALIQLMYSFKNKTLMQHRLAFYPSPSLLPYQDDPESYDADELYLDIINRKLVPFPIRFDFDLNEKTYKDVKHPISHLTLGNAKNCRIPVTAPISPYWFMAFILRNFYQTDKSDFASGLPNSKLKFQKTITVNEQNLVHLVIPY